MDSNGDGSVDLAQRYALDGWDIYADLDASSSLTTRYVRGEVVDQLFARLESDGSAFWDYTDHLGSIRDTDNSGLVVDALTYDAFGNILSETDANYRGRYAYTGRELDVETGLQYNRARYYDAATGRWLSQDPLGFGAGDSNLYRYVKNQPIIGTDPGGFGWWARRWGDFKNGLQMLGRGFEELPAATMRAGSRFKDSATNLAHGRVNPDFVNGLKMLRDDPVSKGWEVTKIGVQIVTEPPRKLGEGIATGDGRKIVEGGAQTALMYLSARSLPQAKPSPPVPNTVVNRANPGANTPNPQVNMFQGQARTPPSGNPSFPPPIQQQPTTPRCYNPQATTLPPGIAPRNVLASTRGMATSGFRNNDPFTAVDISRIESYLQRLGVPAENYTIESAR